MQRRSVAVLGLCRAEHVKNGLPSDRLTVGFSSTRSISMSGVAVRALGAGP